jgi:aspartate kinase
VSGKVKIGGIMANGGMAKVGMMSVPDRPGVAATILRGLGEQGVNVQFIVQCIDLENRDHVVLCVSRSDLDTTLELLEATRTDVGAQAVIQVPDVGIVSVFGPDFRERPGIAAHVFEALASEGINILAISTSISTVSCVIAEESLDRAAEVLGETFTLP